MKNIVLLSCSLVAIAFLSACELFPMDTGDGNDRPANRPAEPSPSPSPANPGGGADNGSSGQNLDGVVRGSVTYLERIAMPPNAIITVKLVDVARADAPARTIAEQIITNLSGVPVSYELRFDRGRIDEKHIYQVQAKLTSNGTVMFSSTKSYQVLTRGKGNTADIILGRPN